MIHLLRARATSEQLTEMTEVSKKTFGEPIGFPYSKKFGINPSSISARTKITPLWKFLPLTFEIV